MFRLRIYTITQYWFPDLPNWRWLFWHIQCSGEHIGCLHIYRIFILQQKQRMWCHRYVDFVSILSPPTTLHHSAHCKDTAKTIEMQHRMKQVTYVTMNSNCMFVGMLMCIVRVRLTELSFFWSVLPIRVASFLELMNHKMEWSSIMRIITVII